MPMPDATDSAPELPTTVPGLLHSVAEQFGDRVYLRADGQSLTYRELEARSAQLARALLADGVGKRDHVGILMPNGVDWATAWFAVTRIGAVAVPLNTFQKPAELAWTIRHADLRVILAVARLGSNDFVERLERALPGLSEQRTPGRLHVPAAPYLRMIGVWGGRAESVSWMTAMAGAEPAEMAGAELLSAVEACVTASDDCVIVYTSGSTGPPKGPRHSHGTLVRHSRRLTSIYVVDGTDVLYTAMPFFWIGGLMSGLHGVIHHGATLVTQAMFDPGTALELIEKHRVTVTLGWPQQGKTLSEHPDFACRNLTSVKRTSMPATVPPDRQAPETGARCLGMTELCGVHLGENPYLPQPEHRRGAYGPSLPGLSHRVVDPESGLDVPVGQAGEIWVRGYALMQGLYKQEREETFTPDGYYRTGDAGYADADGWVTYTGRLGDMIKTGGGTNVTPSEVEAVLGTQPDVLEAYVVGARDGDRGDVVAAAVVPRSGRHVDPDDLRRRVKNELSAYKVPKFIWVTEKHLLPFTDTGKLKRAQLAEQLAAELSARRADEAS